MNISDIMLKITKDMKISEILEKHPELREVFIEKGLMCAICHMSTLETLEQGAQAHGMDVNKLLKDLNNAIKEK